METQTDSSPGSPSIIRTRSVLRSRSSERREGVRRIAGLYMLVFKNQTLFIADATVNIDPTAEELAEIALLTAETGEAHRCRPADRDALVQQFRKHAASVDGKGPKGNGDHRAASDPNLIVDGEMMADTAMSSEMLNELYPFSTLKEPANILICPDLTSANIAYKLLVACRRGISDRADPDRHSKAGLSSDAGSGSERYREYHGDGGVRISAGKIADSLF